ncbi:hypothetical protein [Streptomyces radicis]|uniref:hypothetical protein n=1 Tax=Streptomyces radicis TaxID=1750517 RepID=UPI0011C366AC|nr:hypothetical protein [Streptomyces radicis]
MKSRRISPLAVIGAVGAALTLGTVPPAAALPTLVPCSVTALVDAVEDANTAGGGDLLLATGCTYTLTAAYSGEDGLPPITSDIDILGTGTTITRSATAPDFRLFHVAATGDLELSVLTLSGGSVTGNGGAVLNEGDLTVNASTVSGSSADGQGGGIASTGTLSVDAASRITTNTAATGGGGILTEGTATLRASTVDRNQVTGTAALGGGLLNDGGTVTIEASGIASNTATADDGSGAGIATVGGTVTVNLGVVEGNRADTAPGGISNDGGTVTLTLSPVFGNTPGNCTGSPDPVPNCFN